MPLTVVIRRRSSRLPRRRRWPIFAVAIILIVGMSAPFWGVGFFRNNLIEAVSYKIDRPTDIAKLTLRLTPTPVLVAHDVQIGHPEFNVRADRVTIEIRTAPLGRRVVDVASIRIDGLVWTIPEKPGDLAHEINTLTLQPSRGEGKWSGVIAEAYAQNAKIVFAGQEDPALIGRISVRDVLSDEIKLTAEAAVPVAGEAAILKGTASFLKRTTGDFPLAIEGNATLNNIASRAFVNEDLVPNTQLDFPTITFERIGPKSVAIKMRGDSHPASAEAVEVEALTGAFAATAMWKDGRTGVHIDEWRAGGFDFTGTIVVAQDGTITTAIEKGSANAAGIEAYFKLRPLAKYTVKPRTDAKLSVVDFRLLQTADKPLLLEDGNATFSGVDLLVEDGAQAFKDFSGNVSFADNVITLENVAGDGLTVMGTVHPDFANETYRFDLRGEATLSRERLSGLIETDSMKEAAGHIQFTNLKGTAAPDEGLPDDLVIEGKLTDGHFRFESPEWSDTLENVVLTFDAEADQIATSIAAQSTMFGTVKADGTFLVADDRWDGTVSGDFSTVVLPSLEGTTREVADGILRDLGRSILEIKIDASSEDDDRVLVDVTRGDGQPTLTAAVAFSRGTDAWVLADVAVSADLSSSVINPIAPDALAATGPLAVHFERSAADQRFRSIVNLDAATVTFGDHLTKRSGAPLSFSIEGTANDDLWAANIIDTTILDTHFRGTLDGDRFTVESLDIDIASLSPLLSDGGSASGHITGSIHTSPTDVALRLNDVQVTINEALTADQISGDLRVTDKGVETDQLHVNAANSQFTLNLRETEGRWSGGIEGSQIDANAMTDFLDAFRSLTNPEAESHSLASIDAVESGQSLLAGESETPSDLAKPIQDDTTPIASPGLTGEFDINIDTLLYRKATLSNVRTRLVASDGNFSANDLSFVPITGTASGNIRYSQGQPPHGNRVAVDLAFEDVDAKIVDDLVFEEPRNITGLLAGNLMMSVPIGAEGVNLGGVNGSLQVSGADGTLGSLGFANAVLFVFKTTEILFLRSPFAESGLSYKKLNGNASIENGVVTLGVLKDGTYTEAITLQRPSYRMSAIGWVDLGEWDSEVIVHMEPLSSVADAARIFKIDEVEVINSRGGIRILMTGPPDDPKTEIAFGGPVNAITKEIRGGFRSVQGLVKDQIIDGIGGILRGLLER